VAVKAESDAAGVAQRPVSLAAGDKDLVWLVSVSWAPAGDRERAASMRLAIWSMVSAKRVTADVASCSPHPAT
jgi:hypothetical protein